MLGSRRCICDKSNLDAMRGRQFSEWIWSLLIIPRHNKPSTSVRKPSRCRRMPSININFDSVFNCWSPGDGGVGSSAVELLSTLKGPLHRTTICQTIDCSVSQALSATRGRFVRCWQMNFHLYYTVVRVCESDSVSVNGTGIF